MASPVSHKPDEIPVIWLLAPEVLTPSPDPIRPIPIAISATLATLIFLTLVILYNKKPKATSREYTDIDLENLKASIRVIHPASAAPSSAVSESPHVARTPPPRPTRSPPQSHSESGSDTLGGLRVNTYHEALKDIRDAPHNSSTRRFSLTSAAGSNYPSPDSMTVSRDGDNKSDDQLAQNIIRPASSDYSVSIGPTPLPSRRGSVRTREVNGVWTRLRLGSEYDGDRTFVPSEANLQLGREKGDARWGQ